MMFLAAFLGCSLALEVRAQIIRAVIVPMMRRRLIREATRRGAREILARHDAPWVSIGAAAVEYDQTGRSEHLLSAATALSRSLSHDDRRQLRDRTIWPE